MDLYQYLFDSYGYNEPVFLEELQENDDIKMKSSTLRMNLKRLVDEGKMNRYDRGVYFIPNPNSLLKKQSLSIDKVINKKYLYDKDNPIGYRTGIAFANQLKLTSQTAGVIELVTNKETNRKRATKINDWRIVLRKPRKEIEQKNIKVLQVLDLLNNYDKFSEKTLAEGSITVIDYLNDVEMKQNELNEILYEYPKETIMKVNESGIYDALTR